MGQAPASFETKREVIRTLVVTGRQTTKIIVDPSRLPPDGAGFPKSILDRFSSGIPLELDPTMPLELDLDGDPHHIAMTLAFQGTITRCAIPWGAVVFIGVGQPFLATPWNDDLRGGLPAPATPRARPSKAKKKGGLRVVK